MGLPHWLTTADNVPSACGNCVASASFAGNRPSRAMRRARAVGLVAATSIFVASIAARAEPFPTRPVFAVRSCNQSPRNWCLLCSTHSGWHVQAYYLWYGTPEVDGEWRHWNHSVLPHWREDVRRRYPSDGEHTRPSGASNRVRCS